MEKEMLITELQDMYDKIVDGDQSVIILSAILFVYLMFLMLTGKRKNREDK